MEVLTNFRLLKNFHLQNRPNLHVLLFIVESHKIIVSISTNCLFLECNCLAQNLLMPSFLTLLIPPYNWFWIKCKYNNTKITRINIKHN